MRDLRFGAHRLRFNSMKVLIFAFFICLDVSVNTPATAGQTSGLAKGSAAELVDVEIVKYA